MSWAFVNLFRVRRELLMTVTVELIDALSSSEEKLVDEEVLESGGGGGREVGRGTEFIVAGSGGGGGKWYLCKLNHVPLKFNNAFNITCSRVVGHQSHHFSRVIFDGILEMQGVGINKLSKWDLRVEVVVVVKKKAVCRRGKVRARIVPRPSYSIDPAESEKLRGGSIESP